MLRPVLMLALIGAFIAGAVAAAGPDQSLYADFQQNCVSHVSDAVGALNAVSQKGWKPIAQDKLPRLSFPGMRAEWYHAHVKAWPERSVALIAGRGEMFTGTTLKLMPVTFCMAMQKPLDDESLRRIGVWANVPGVVAGPGTTSYIFSDDPNGHHGIGLSEVYRAFQSGAGRELVVMSHPNEHGSEIGVFAPVQGR